MSFGIVNDDARTDNELVDKGTDVHNNYSKDKMVSSSLAAFATLAMGVSPAVLAVGIATGQYSNTESFDDGVDGTIIDSFMQTWQQCESGDWASGIAGIVGLGVDVASAIMDPIGFVAGQLVGWMMEHVEPLRAVLHQLTGNPDMVEAYSKTWKNIGDKLAEQGAQYMEAVKAETQEWAGKAADAYRASASATIKKTAGAAVGAAALSAATLKMKDVVESVRGGVRDILADLAGTLVTCAIECLTVVGAPDAARRALQAIAKAALKTSDLLVKLALVISKLGAVIVDLVQLLNELNQNR